MRIIVFISFCIVLLSCTNSKVPYNIIQPKEMEEILWEQMKADAFAKEYQNKNIAADVENQNIIIQQKIFEKYGVDKKKFYKSYQFYLAHEDILKNVLDSIIVKQTRHKDEERSRLSYTLNTDLFVQFSLQGYKAAQFKVDTVPVLYPIYKPTNYLKRPALLKF
jgi:Domain of unknown function (DUF4296)